MQLEGGLFLTDEFINFSKEVIAYVNITSAIPDRAEDTLLGTYGFRSFPSFGIMDAEGNLLSAHQGQRTVQAFRQSVEAVQILARLKAQVAAGDKQAEVNLEIINLIDSVRSREDLPKAGEKLYSLYQEGKELNIDVPHRLRYMGFMIQKASEEKDVKTFEIFLDRLKALQKEKDLDIQKNIDAMETNLQKIKAEQAAPEGS